MQARETWRKIVLVMKAQMIVIAAGAGIVTATRPLYRYDILDFSFLALSSPST
jgi:hypothetical protein